MLHFCPESGVGENLGLVHNGDEIELDAASRKLHLHVTDDMLAQRRTLWQPPPKPAGADRGYYKLYFEHVLQVLKLRKAVTLALCCRRMQDAAAAKSLLAPL